MLLICHDESPDEVYTHTGDDGRTGLADGSRVPKDAPLFKAIGVIDGLNSMLGVLPGGSR